MNKNHTTDHDAHHSDDLTILADIETTQEDDLPEAASYTAKEQLRQTIAEQVEQFLSQGGAIEHVEQRKTDVVNKRVEQ